MFRKTLLALLLAASGVSAHAALNTGDIAFTSFNADEDGWSIVALKSIDANSTIYFNDNEWSGTSFNTGEGSLTWSSGAATIDAGSVIRFNLVDKASRNATFGTLIAAGDNGINATSETIYAYLGSNVSTPTTFLAGISSEGTTNLTPAGLNNGSTAIVVTNSTDYAQYTGMRSGANSFSAYSPMVNNAANWNILVGGDQALQSPNTIAFSVPEPESYALFLAGLGLMGTIARRRRAR